MIDSVILFCVYVVKCQISTIDNGIAVCDLGDDEVYSYEDRCNLTCNSGYILIGSGTQTCLNDGSWSRTNSTCERGNSYYQDHHN